MPTSTFAFSLPQLWRSRAKTILKALFIAVLPFIVFLAIDYWLHWSIQGSLLNYVTIGLFIWAALSVIVPLDRDLSSKISVFTAIKGLLSSGTDHNL